MRINNIYTRVIVVGIGAVATSCILELKNRGVNVEVLATRSNTVLSMKSFCERNNIDYIEIEVESITSFLMSITEKTLLLSISNRYIFPNTVITKDNLEIINYHGALLPKYPGRNAEAWAIFNQESVGGITWHKVAKEIDAGEIIIQKELDISKDITSLLLLKKYGVIALEGFKEILSSLLDGSYVSFPQKGEIHKMRYSSMKPNNGYLDIDWDGHKISAFLRSMDYGPLQTFGVPKIILLDKEYNIEKYIITPIKISNDGYLLDENSMTLQINKNNLSIKLYLK